MPLRPTAFPPQAAEYRRDGSWDGSPLGERFAETCARHASAIALVDDERRLTFAEWERLSAQAAAGLHDLGIVAGDVVAYQLPNWWEAAVVFLAAARIGAVVNPLLPIFRARELRFALAQSGAAALVIPAVYRGCDHMKLVSEL